MKIKPLTGQVLVEILPSETQSAGGIRLPDHTLSPEEHQERSHSPTPPPGITGIVRAIGSWPKLPSGRALMPEFGIGNKVVLRPHSGQDMQRNVGERFKMVLQDDVLAVLT